MPGFNLRAGGVGAGRSLGVRNSVDNMVNHLGRLLMVVRDRASAILDGDFTHPEGFLLD